MSQADIAAHTRVSASSISRLEGGAASEMTLRAIRTIAAAYGVRVDVIARWRGGDLDRLLSAHHSAMHESVSRWLARFPGWIFVPEATFSFGRETGIVDVLGWHPATRTTVVLELKTRIIDVNELIGVMDRRRRLASRMALERGWLRPHGHADRQVAADGTRPRADEPRIVTWVLVADGATNRRRVAAHTDVLRRAFPAGHCDLRALLQDPARIGRRVVAPAHGPGQQAFGGPEGVAGLSFFAYAHGAGARAALDPIHRVSRRSRVARTPGGERGAAIRRSTGNDKG
jgi:hypothetical protein